MLYVGLHVGCLVVFLGIGCYAYAEVCAVALLHCGVEILSVVQVVYHAHQFRAVREAVAFGYENLLSGQCIASQGYDIVDAKKVEVKQFAFHSAARGPATDDVWHYLQLGIAAHDGCHDGYRAWAFCQCHAGVVAVAIGHEFHFVAVAGDIHKGRLELHQWVETLIETACVAALQWRHELEAGKGALAAVEDVYDFHVMMSGLCI